MLQGMLQAKQQADILPVMIYGLLKKFLFCFDPEKTHVFVLKSLKFLIRGPIRTFLEKRKVTKPIEVMGLKFQNRLGLAAGLDRNGEYVDALSALGFGFIEVGTVVLNKQPGHEKPRLFRIPEKNALINRMGFYSEGLEYFLKHIQQRKYQGILGINIVKNFTTPIKDAVPDYVACFEAVYPHASYIAANISSPNTPGLRDLQYGDHLDQLLSSLKQKQAELFEQSGNYVPLVIKIAPDLSDEEIQQLALQFLQHKIDGVLAGNTTLSRPNLQACKHGDEQGGLSGAPLFSLALNVVTKMHKALQGQVPIIACGGISSREDADKMMQAGASLVQIYSGFIYHGPAIIRQIAQ